MKQHLTCIDWWSPLQVSRNTNQKVLFMWLCFPFLYEVVCFFITLFIWSSDIFRKDALFFTLMHLSSTQLIVFTSNSQMSILLSMPVVRKSYGAFFVKLELKSSYHFKCTKYYLHLNVYYFQFITFFVNIMGWFSAKDIRKYETHL